METYRTDLMFGRILENQDLIDDHPSMGFNSLNKPEDPTVEGLAAISVVEFLHSSSLQLGHRDYTISFQDGFIDEHEEAIKKEIENFMEFSVKEGNLKNISFESEDIFGEDLEFGHFNNSEDILLDFKNKTLLLQQTSLDQMFSVFFELLPKKVASEMLYICSFAEGLNEVSSCFQMEPKKAAFNLYESEEQAVQSAKKLADKLSLQLFKDEKIKFLNLSKVPKSELNQESEIKKAFKRLVEFLLATTGLIGSGFFSNPYTKSTENKRIRPFSLEDEEESSSSTNQLGQPKKRSH